MNKQAFILFDLGNVLVRLNSVDQFWAGKIPVQPHEICQQRWIGSQAVRDLETGKINDFNEFYTLALQELELDLKFSEFENIFVSLIGEKFAQTDKLLSELSKYHRIMILSDTSEVHWQYCKNKLGLGRFIEKAFLSYEIGFMKPDKRVYEAVLAEVEDIPQNIYYFDDKPENVSAGAETGMKAFVSWGGEKLISQLKELGLLDKNVKL